MICKIIWGWVQNGFISLPVVWLADFPTNCGFMRAFKKHVFIWGPKKPQQIGKNKGKISSNSFTSAQSLSEEEEKHLTRKRLRLSRSRNGRTKALLSLPRRVPISWGALLLAPAHFMCPPGLPVSFPALQATCSFFLAPALPWTAREGEMTSKVLKFGFSC